MRLILQLCLLVLMLLGAEKRAWGKVATSPQAAVRDWVQDSRLGGGIDAPPRQPTSREAAAWDDDIASAGDIHREDTLTMAGPVVVTSRGTAFLMCPGAPPPFIGSYRTTTPAWVAYGPNVYAYVRQNPWTAWDPHGLATIEGHKKAIARIDSKLEHKMKNGGISVLDLAVAVAAQNAHRNAIQKIEATAKNMNQCIDFLNWTQRRLGKEELHYRVRAGAIDDENADHKWVFDASSNWSKFKFDAAATSVSAGLGVAGKVGSIFTRVGKAVAVSPTRAAVTLGDDLSSASGTRVWRHIPDGHPALAEAQAGVIKPYGATMDASLETRAFAHDVGYTKGSGLTSWTADHSWALSRQQRMGGVVVETVAPEGSVWFNQAARGAESQILIPGTVHVK